MTVSRRELRLRAQEEAARLAAEEAAPPPSSQVSAQPLTRRQLREQRILQETGDIPAIAEGLAAPEADDAPPAPPAAETEQPAPTASGPQVADPASIEPGPESQPAPAPERPLRRRRPVLPPQQTGSMPVIDPETGTIGAVTISFPTEPAVVDSVPSAGSAPSPDAAPERPMEPEDIAPAPPAESGPLLAVSPIAPEPPAVPEIPPSAPSPEEIVAPAATAPAITLPPPALEQRSDLSFDEILADPLAAPAETAAPQRASLFDKMSNDDLDAASREIADVVEEDERSMTVEQADLATKVSPIVTVMRYLVLVIAMFVIGGLIWLMVDGARDSASAVGLVVSSLGSVRT